MDSRSAGAIPAICSSVRASTCRIIACCFVSPHFCNVRRYIHELGFVDLLAGLELEVPVVPKVVVHLNRTGVVAVAAAVDTVAVAVALEP